MVPPTKKYESNSRESNASQVPWRSTHKSESIDSSAPWPVPASARQVVLSTKKYESDDFQESNDSQVPRSSVRQECGSAAHLHLRSGGPVRPPTLMFLGSILIATAVVWKFGVVQSENALSPKRKSGVSTTLTTFAAWTRKCWTGPTSNNVVPHHLVSRSIRRVDAQPLSLAGNGEELALCNMFHMCGLPTCFVPLCRGMRLCRAQVSHVFVHLPSENVGPDADQM